MERSPSIACCGSGKTSQNWHGHYHDTWQTLSLDLKMLTRKLKTEDIYSQGWWLTVSTDEDERGTISLYDKECLHYLASPTDPGCIWVPSGVANWIPLDRITELKALEAARQKEKATRLRRIEERCRAIVRSKSVPKRLVKPTNDIQPMCTLCSWSIYFLHVLERAPQVRACCAQSDQDVFNLKSDIQRKYLAIFLQFEGPYQGAACHLQWCHIIIGLSASISPIELRLIEFDKGQIFDQQNKTWNTCNTTGTYSLALITDTIW